MKISVFNYKPLLSTLGFFLYFAGALNASAAVLDISQKPLILSESVPPNLVFTLDDSGSMRWAFAPDDSGREASAINLRNTRRGMSSTTNPMYYNPNAEYLIPVKLNTDGTSPATGYTTSFTQAYQNGFQTSYGDINLANNYRVSWNFNTDQAVTYDYNSSTTYAAPTGQIFSLSENPTIDFGGNENVTLTSGSPIQKNFLGITHTFTRNSNNSCTVTPATPGITCARNSGDSYKITRSRTRTAVPAYYYIYDASLAGCNADKNNDACYRAVFVSANSGPNGADERQNFAIWYSFYRTRALATVSAANLAFNELSPSARLTWQTLGVCTTLDSSNCGTNYFREYGTRHKANFLNWLANVKFNSSTPLLAATQRAGEFYTKPVPWARNPNPMTSNGGRGTTVTAPEYACRPSFHVLMTDGMWNDNSFPSGIDRHDGASFKPGASNSGSYDYDGKRAPFGNDNKVTTGTLADIAMHYWATDLRPGLGNDLKPYIHTKNSNLETQFWDPRNNPATWQHMVNYTMGLGLNNSLNAVNIPWTGDTFGGPGYANLLANTAKWPEASASNTNNVYDLWHAAINSRGEFFSVDSPEDMVKAFKNILNRIADRTTSAARPAVSASFVSDGTDETLASNVYATQFSSTDWSGEIIKTLIDGNQTVKWKAQTANQGLVAATRKVMMKDLTNATSQLKDFTWANLGSMQSLLSVNPESLAGATDSLGAQRVAYIRGDRSLEGTTSPAFRTRSTILGDIVNSSPAVVGTPPYQAYRADKIENPSGTLSGYQSYAEFKAANKRPLRKEMIYVGGNDGMLHGFNAETGVEEFAFIPTEVIKNLYRLTGQNYTGAEHRYFVDGSPIVRDVYFGNGSDEGWHTLLIGTLRGGGKSLFALDITDPDDIKLLWEFDSTTDTDLGYTFAQPEIVRLHSGQWAVLMGNGYNSTDDKAALMIIDIKTGSLLKKLTVPPAVDSGVTKPNGLSSVRGADNDGDGLVDYAYAGDLQGNLWRFDLVPTVLPTSPSSTKTALTGNPFSRDTLTNVTVNDFKIAYGGTPLFTARDSNSNPGNRQAITILPSLVRHPSGIGYLVLIGTGKYVESSDANVDTSRAMTVYGVWDRHTKRQTTSATTAKATDRSGMQTQSFTDQTKFRDKKLVVSNTDIRLLSENPVKWIQDYNQANPNANSNDQTHDASVNRWGWSLDLSVNSQLDGEMVINNMAASGDVLFLSSLTPNQDPCASGADTWFYGIDPYTGGRTTFDVLDVNGDKIVNSGDQHRGEEVVSGMRFPAIGGFTLAPGNQAFGSGGADDPVTVGDGPNNTGRQSWHVIPEEFQ